MPAQAMGYRPSTMNGAPTGPEPSPSTVRGAHGEGPDPVVLAGFAKALGHPARVRILSFLLRSEACMCGQICDVLPLAQSTVSQHLKILKQAGLIVGEIDGPRVCYAPVPEALATVRKLLEELTSPLGCGAADPPASIPATPEGVP